MKARIKDPKYEGKVFECELAPYGDEFLLSMKDGEKVLFEGIDIEIVEEFKEDLSDNLEGWFEKEE